VNDESIKSLFLQFVKKMDMSSSYKPVLLLSLLDKADKRGRARLGDVVDSFWHYYLARARAGLQVERSNLRMFEAQRLSEDEVRSVMLEMPFTKFERRRFLCYDKSDLAFIRFQPKLWEQLTTEDLAILRGYCEQAIANYYERIKR
jgi:hypothetical protein